MTEAALAPTASQGTHRVLRRASRSRLSPMEALERGFALFRSTFARDAWRYYVGATPLVLCLIPIWVVNGQIRISNGALLAEVALLVGGYVLRVWMVGGYMRNIRERAFGTPISKPVGAMAQAASVGRLLAWKILLSACALIALPSFAGAAWFYSACQFASLEAPENGERHSLSGCMGLASQWFGSGVLLFLMLFPLWIAVWLNCAIVAIILPQLLHSIFGVNSLLSTPMGMFALVRSSAFWLSLIAGTWLALDPVVKCTFVIVYQHLRSRREGDDLRGLLASLPREQEKKAQMVALEAARSRIMSGALFVLATILFSASLTTPARAAQVLPTPSTTETLSGSAHEARVQELRKALDEESRRAIYRWHDAEHPSPPTWFEKLLTKIGNSIERAWNAIVRFLRRLWPSGLNLSLGKENGGSWQLKDLRLWLTLIAILTLVSGAMFFWLRRRHETTTLSIPQEIALLPDLNDSAVATERSEDDWFALANRLEGEGELRFALRATYFGLLVGLAQREWLTIRRDRTNREYLNEFTRRWRRRPQAAVEVQAQIPEKLRGSLRQFDQVWYGLHAVTPEAVAAYRQDQQEFLSHV